MSLEEGERKEQEEQCVIERQRACYYYTGIVANGSASDLNFGGKFS
jgi:hypothetical protein